MESNIDLRFEHFQRIQNRGGNGSANRSRQDFRRNGFGHDVIQTWKSMQKSRRLLLGLGYLYNYIYIPNATERLVDLSILLEWFSVASVWMWCVMWVRMMSKGCEKKTRRQKVRMNENFPTRMIIQKIGPRSLCITTTNSSISINPE